MPHRTLSSTGYYHITSRSAGKIALFEDDEDRRHYLRLLKVAKEETAVSVLSWVLMTDHVHLVIDTGDDPSRISTFMHMINSRYTRYFNAKTGRVGTLFQGRYWSKPITSDAQLIATVHYVHMNPEAANICPMRTYRWSSYQEYLGKKWVVDTSTILGLFGSFESFDAYQGSPKDVVRKYSHPNHDSDVLLRALSLAEVPTSDTLRSLPIDKRNAVIAKLSKEGFSIRQISRALGIGTTIVHRVIRVNGKLPGT